MIRSLLFLLLLSPLSILAEARDPQGYEQILLPVIRARGGAFGSFWVTELHARNEGTEAVQVFQTECAYFCDCPGRIATCAPGSATLPGARVPIGISSAAPPNTGVFVYASRIAAHDLAIALRTADTSRLIDNAGTEIPVVRERDFRRGKTTLLNVPVEFGFRQHLRIFGISSPSEASEVVVRVYDNHGDTVLSERRLILAPSTDELLLPLPNSRPSVPSYGEIIGVNLVGTLPRSGRIRIEIEAVTPGLVYWPFVSVINNTTQHLTLVTPQ